MVKFKIRGSEQEKVNELSLELWAGDIALKCNGHIVGWFTSTATFWISQALSEGEKSFQLPSSFLEK